MLQRHAVRTFLPAAALFAATAVLSPIGGAAGVQQDPLQGKIGVVQMTELSKEYPGAAARNDRFEAEKAIAKQELDALAQRAKDLSVDREGLQPGTDRHEALTVDLQILQNELETRSRAWEMRLNRLQLELSEDLFAEVQRGIAEFAKRRGLLMMFRVHPVSERLGKRNDDQRNTELIYHDEALDVTEACRQFLKGWKGQGG